MTNLFETVEELAASGYIFRIQDSGPTSIDRITVVFCDGDYLALSETGSGFSQWGERIDPAVMAEWAENGEAVDLALGDLKPELREHILTRVNEAWRDFLEMVERRHPSAVAPTREKANENDGTYSSAGVGIYSAGEGYCLRLEGSNAADDRGPYMLAREALAASFPDENALAGPEYHSPLDVASLEPTPGVAEAVAAMESAS